MRYGWGATSEYRFQIGDFAPKGAGWPKISGGKGCSTNHSSSQKTRLNDHFVRYKNLDRSFFSFETMHAFDRRTDRRTERILIARRTRLYSMQRGKKQWYRFHNGFHYHCHLLTNVTKYSKDIILGLYIDIITVVTKAQSDSPAIVVNPVWPVK